MQQLLKNVLTATVLMFVAVLTATIIESRPANAVGETGMRQQTFSTERTWRVAQAEALKAAKERQQKAIQKFQGKNQGQQNKANQKKSGQQGHKARPNAKRTGQPKRKLNNRKSNSVGQGKRGPGKHNAGQRRNPSQKNAVQGQQKQRANPQGQRFRNGATGQRNNERKVRGEGQHRNRTGQGTAGKRRDWQRNPQGIQRNQANPNRNANQQRKFQRRVRRDRNRKRMKFRDRRPEVVRSGNSITVRRRAINRKAGRSRFAHSRRFRARHRRARNRFRNGISIFALPPIGLALALDRYIVDSSRGSYELYLDTFLAPPLGDYDRRYTLDEIIGQPELRARVRSVNLNTINFEFGSAEVTDDEVDKLEDLANAMLRVLDRNPDHRFLIEGHTDAVGTFDDNLLLSEDRAASVQIVLIEEFDVPAESLEAVGYGEQYLRVNTEGPERRNRRVVVRNIGRILAGGD